MIRLATINLYHFAEPPIWWYRRDLAGRNRFSAHEWAAKTAWLAATLAEIDADVVGFQEVVSVDRLKALCAEAGYSAFGVVAAPQLIVEGGEPVYVRPVQAIASRYPMRVERTAPRAGFAASLGLGESWDFRRPPVRAEVDLPGLGPVDVTCCHLKSPGAAVDDAPIDGDPTPGADPARAAVEGLSRAHAFAVLQRAVEASAVYHDVAERLTAAPERLAVVMGDLNDTPDSPALRALTPRAAGERDGGAFDGAAPAAGAARYRLVDADRLAPASERGQRQGAPTHRSGARGERIDFILLSPAAQPWRADGVAEVVDLTVHDRHFYAQDPRTTSDHAPVSIGLRPR